MAAWLYDVLKPHVAELVVCNPRRNASLTRSRTKTPIADTVFFISLISILCGLSLRSQSETSSRRQPRRSRSTVNQPDAVSVMIFTIVSSTSFATPSSCGESNIPRRMVGLRDANIVLPPSS